MNAGLSNIPRQATRFTITASEFCSLWEFDLENENLRGHWIGVFTPQKTATMVEFTEKIDVRNPLMRLFARRYLKRQQARYLADLRAELERECIEKARPIRK